MAPRAKGSPVIVYLEHADTWVDAEVVEYVRGFGYEVSYVHDGTSESGKTGLKQIL